MQAFETMTLPARPDVTAPDGSRVRVLLSLRGGSMAHFELPPEEVSTAVEHRSVEEIWYVLSGRGEMWRRQDGQEAVTAVGPGTCLTIPLGTRFQFRAFGAESLTAVAVTMPPWPGPDEAVRCEGAWTATVE